MVKSRFIYIILLLSFIGFYFFTGEYIAFTALLVIILLPLFLYVITILTSIFIKPQFKNTDNTAQKQTPCKVFIDIINNSILHISVAKMTLKVENVYTKQNLKEFIVVPINAKQITTIDTGIISNYCGNVKITIQKIKVYDFFAITSHSKKINKSLIISVLPNIIKIDANADIEIIKDDESSMYSTEKSGDDGSQVFDYHEYNRGDRVKNINWKLSTKLDKLMVKELSLPISSSVCIALELGTCDDKINNISIIDAQIEVYASISSWLFLNDVPHEAEWYNPADSLIVNMKLTSVEDMSLSIQQIYDTKPHSNNILLDEIANKTVKPKISNLIYITSTLSNDSLKPLFRLRELFNITVFYISDEKIQNNTIDDLKLSLINKDINLNVIDAHATQESLLKMTL